LLVVGLGTLRGLMGFFSRYFGEKLSHFAAYDVRNELYDKVQRLQFGYHDKAQTGTLITRAISDVDEIQRYFAFGLIDGLTTFLLVTGVILVMLVSSPILAVVTLLPLIPLMVMSRNYALAIDPRWKRVMERIQVLSEHLQENAVGAQVVRAFAREKYEIAKWNKENEELFEEQLSLVNRWTSYMPISAFIIAFSTALVLFVGGWMEQNKISGVTVGLVVSFNAYVFLIAQPIRFLGFVILLFTQAVTSSRRVFEILDAPMVIQDKPAARAMPPIKGYVKFEKVSFAYEGDGPGENGAAHPHDRVLRDITLEARPSEIIALLGQTGSGKSTLVNLIPRFYDVTEGRITIDGVDIRDVQLASLREQIGIVLQESTLFSATIRENICYGRPDATLEEVIAAAKAANAHEFILEFPDGYETEIGERGVTVSGGQRQRIAIARALLVNPHILILDDSTSSVDTRTEFLIQEALDRLMEGRTTFVIAQRLTTVQNASQILVLDQGEIAEHGTHQELLDQNGLYADIYRLQLADQERLKRELMALGGLVEEKTKRSTSDMQVHVGQLSG
jgi:ATP-binding cassette subfamily B protein